MTALILDNFSSAPFLMLPVWLRAILFSVSTASDSSSPSEADRADIAAARLGDGEAYSRIIRRHQCMLARRMTRFASDRATVEELVHDSFVEAFFSLRSFRGDAPLEHWLAKIATRVGYRYWKTTRRDRAREAQLRSSGSPTASAADGTVDSEEMTRYLLDQLSPRDRLAITLLHLEGRSVSEAAEMAGWSQTMMKVQAYRARKKLRNLLEEQGIFDG